VEKKAKVLKMNKIVLSGGSCSLDTTRHTGTVSPLHFFLSPSPRLSLPQTTLAYGGNVLLFNDRLAPLIMRLLYFVRSSNNFSIYLQVLQVCEASAFKPLLQKIVSCTL